MDDYMVRAIAADGTIRAFAAYTRNTVEKARSLHNTSPVITSLSPFIMLPIIAPAVRSLPMSASRLEQ